jgi:hypothetical protein
VGCGYAPGTGAAILVFPNITPGFGSTPTLASLVSSDATPGDVSLVWDLGASLASATIERRTATTDWAALASLSPDGSGRLRYDDRAVVAGARYAYRLRLGATTTTETWIDVPLAYTLAIRGATPNPSRGPLTVAFTLASAERAQLDVVDVAGRRVRSLDLAAPTAGAQSARLDAGSPLAPGLYFVRLVQGRARAMARVAVIR